MAFLGGAMKWHVFPDRDAVAVAVSEAILDEARRAIARSGRFLLVLAGGGTPALSYRHLASSGADFSRWIFFLGDERCLPVSASGRNSRMVEQTLLAPAGIDASRFHAIPSELGAEEAARAYEREIEPFLPFDCVLLGMGEDGHVASLFPGQDYPDEALVTPVHDAPKPPPDRVSLNAPVLMGARSRLFVITGETKRAAVQRWRSGARLPVAHVAAADPTEVFIDRAAFGRQEG